MKKLGTAVLVVMGLTVAAQGNAQAYYGIGFGNYELTMDFDDIASGLKGKADVKSLEGLLGFEQTPYITWEVRLGLGLGSDDMSLHWGGQSIGTDINYKAESYFSGYFRPQFKTKSLQVYGLLGYSSVSGEASFEGEKEDTSDDGFSYGIGAGIIFSEVNSLNIEWKSLAKIDDGEIEGLSINFQRRF